MGKRVKNSKKKALQPELTENMLPQNILPIGDRVEENKNIYILQSVYKEIHKFTQNKTLNESGGMLVGTILEEFGKTNIIISGFVEAKYCEATPTTLKFTHETWEYVHKEIEKKHPGKKIVGWIHTHPDFGIFLSEYDKFIHQNFFNEDYQVAYVVDPIQKIEGFYFWINEKIEKCKGFYIYEKTGAKITVGADKEEAAVAKESSIFSIRNVLIAVLTVAVILLTFSNISTNQKLSKLEEQQKEYILDKQHNVLIAPNYDIVGKSIHGAITGAGYGYCTYYCLSSNFSESTYTDMEKEKLKDILTHTRENAERVSESRILEMLGLI